MIYKYTEWVLFKDGQVSVKEKRVCVRPFGVTKKAIRVYWLDGWLYAPRCYLNTMLILGTRKIIGFGLVKNE